MEFFVFLPLQFFWLLNFDIVSTQEFRKAVNLFPQEYHIDGLDQTIVNAPHTGDATVMIHFVLVRMCGAHGAFPDTGAAPDAFVCINCMTGDQQLGNLHHDGSLEDVTVVKFFANGRNSAAALDCAKQLFGELPYFRIDFLVWPVFVSENARFIAVGPCRGKCRHVTEGCDPYRHAAFLA